MNTKLLTSILQSSNDLITSEQEDALFTYPASCNKESLTLRSIHFLLEDGSTEDLGKFWQNN